MANSCRVYVTGTFDPPLPKEAEEQFYGWIADEGLYEEDCLDGDTNYFVLGFIEYREYMEFEKELLAHLPAGTSVSVDQEFEYTDDGANETKHYGPRARELELAEVEAQIKELETKRDRIKEALAKT